MRNLPPEVHGLDGVAVTSLSVPAAAAGRVGGAWWVADDPGTGRAGSWDWELGSGKWELVVVAAKWAQGAKPTDSLPGEWPREPPRESPGESPGQSPSPPTQSPAARTHSFFNSIPPDAGASAPTFSSLTYLSTVYEDGSHSTRRSHVARISHSTRHAGASAPTLTRRRKRIERHRHRNPA
ncbi:hypothetical protein PMIN01_12689 [Paraphaeosphaeria minitans]|uniref:Uncharacterized protein n=1 Tax=Paraphaeosphaeria minitans TaxID=565426 RepID=A0A9P6G4X1_9PLEO|nr:hypothetical protein PMIN01_12689 [Paraphaeosphaeria minitans]